MKLTLLSANITSSFPISYRIRGQTHIPTLILPISLTVSLSTDFIGEIISCSFTTSGYFFGDSNPLSTVCEGYFYIAI